MRLAGIRGDGEAVGAGVDMPAVIATGAMRDEYEQPSSGG